MLLQECCLYHIHNQHVESCCLYPIEPSRFSRLYKLSHILDCCSNIVNRGRIFCKPSKLFCSVASVLSLTNLDCSVAGSAYWLFISRSINNELAVHASTISNVIVNISSADDFVICTDAVPIYLNCLYVVKRWPSQLPGRTVIERSQPNIHFATTIHECRSHQ